MKRELTAGNVPKNIIFFSLPYLLSYFLQILYGFADMYIIGQFNPISSTTAVSNGSQVMHMATVIIMGLAIGSTVIIGRAVGAKNKAELSKAIGNTVSLFISLSIVFSVILLILTRQIVFLMSTPQEAVEETVAYLTICFIGVPFITAYNIISSIYRGVGDSKSPMYFIAIACAANIALDYLFIGVLDLGASGAALGTTLAQFISVIISFTFITRSGLGVKITKSDLKPNKSVVKSIFKIGLPVSVQDGFIQIAFIVITVIANKRGLNDAAAVGVVEKIIGILFIVPAAMHSAVSVICSQCIGAGKHKRAKSTLLYSMLFTASFGLVTAAIMQFFAGDVVSILRSEPEIVELGSQYLRGYSWDCVFAGIHFCFSGYFCAYGKSIISFIHNFVSITLARIPLAYLASINFPDTLFPMGLATTCGSILSVIICIAFYIFLQKKFKKIDIFKT